MIKRMIKVKIRRIRMMPNRRGDYSLSEDKNKFDMNRSVQIRYVVCLLPYFLKFYSFLLLLVFSLSPSVLFFESQPLISSYLFSSPVFSSLFSYLLFSCLLPSLLSSLLSSSLAFLFIYFSSHLANILLSSTFSFPSISPSFLFFPLLYPLLLSSLIILLSD